jgi:hypothetical protein
LEKGTLGQNSSVFLGLCLCPSVSLSDVAIDFQDRGGGAGATSVMDHDLAALNDHLASVTLGVHELALPTACARELLL